MDPTTFEAVLENQIKILQAVQSGNVPQMFDGGAAQKDTSVFLSQAELLSMGRNSGLQVPTMMQRHSTLANDTHQLDTFPISHRGFFTDCRLDLPILNSTIQPIHTFFNSLQVRQSVLDRRKVGILTSFSGDPTGTAPVNPCDEPFTINDDVAACKVGFDFGRYATRTKTMEIDQLIDRACREGLFDNFFFVGDVQGVSATPSQRLLQNRDLLTSAAVRFQMSLIGRAKQRWSLQRLWTGDPANNTAGGGYRENMGLLNLITDNWQDSAVLAPYIESTGGTQAECINLNSDVKDFNACIGAVDPVNGRGIFNYLQELEDTLYNRAWRMGVLPVEWVIVMPSPHWNELVKAIPCEMVGDGCSGATFGANLAGTVNVNDGGSGMFNMAMREQLKREMAITLNGRGPYRVVLDDAIPYAFDAPTNSYTSSIFFIPLSVSGQLVTYLEHKDYSVIPNDRLAPIPGSQTDLRGWSDAGRFHWIVQRNAWCFELWCKTEWRLIFHAPQLAGRIDRVMACPLQAKDLPFPATAAPVDLP